MESRFKFSSICLDLFSCHTFMSSGRRRAFPTASATFLPRTLPLFWTESPSSTVRPSTRKTTTPLLFWIVSVLDLLRNLTCGLLKSSGRFAFAFFRRGLLLEGLGQGQLLPSLILIVLFLSSFPLPPHYILPLKKPKRRG